MPSNLTTSTKQGYIVSNAILCDVLAAATKTGKVRSISRIHDTVITIKKMSSIFRQDYFSHLFGSIIRT